MKYIDPIPFQILLFEGFTLLDAFGPAEVIGNAEPYRLEFLSASGGGVTSAQGLGVSTQPIEDAEAGGILLVPGGPGTRALVSSQSFLAGLRSWAGKSDALLSVCTGSALLARADLLVNRRAPATRRPGTG